MNHTTPDRFAAWYMQISQRVAQISATYGHDITLTMSHNVNGPYVTLTIPKYETMARDQESYDNSSEAWDLGYALDRLGYYEEHLRRQAQVVNGVKNMLTTLAIPDLEALTTYLRQPNWRPWTQRERLLYEYALAERVKRKLDAKE